MPSGIPKPKAPTTVPDKATKVTPHKSRFASPRQSNGNLDYTINGKIQPKG